MPTNAAYLFLEVASLLGIWLLVSDSFQWRILLSPRFLRDATCLYLLWLVLDRAAVHGRIWWFPQHGSIPLRLLGLPIEEHLFLVLHTLFVAMILAPSASKVAITSDE